MSFNVSYIANESITTSRKGIVSGETKTITPVLGHNFSVFNVGEYRNIAPFGVHYITGDDSGNVVGISNTGEELFKHNLHNGLVSHAIYYTSSMLSTVISSGLNDENILSSNPDTGAVSETYNYEGSGGVPTLCVDSDGGIYAGFQDGTVKRITKNPSAWSFSTGGGAVFDIIEVGASVYAVCNNGEMIRLSKNGELIWRVKLGNVPLSNIVAIQGVGLYAVARNGFVYKVSLTGERVWSVYLGGKELHSLFTLNNCLYIGDDYGYITVVSESGEVVYNTKIINGGIVKGITATIDNKLLVSYIRSNYSKTVDPAILETSLYPDVLGWVPS